ncbi:hypothetical protein ACHAPQ_011018 [Fusarium lateritium]
MSNGFWKQKFLSDMKWVLEFLPSIQELSNSYIDWFKFYKAMIAVSKGQHARKHNAAQGLRNRHRIWEICEQILEDYWPRHVASEQDFEDSSVVLQNADRTMVPILRHPCHEPTMKWTSMSILDTYEAVQDAQPIVTVFWSSEGELSGIGVRATENGARKAITGMVPYAKSDDVKTPKDSWITALEIISQEQIDEEDDSEITHKLVGLRFRFSKGDPIQVGQAEGNGRVVHPHPNNFLVGFTIGWDTGQLISYLDLVSQPFDRVSRDSLRRLRPNHHLHTSGAPVIPAGCGYAGYLWKGGAPPEELTITKAAHGAGGDGTEYESIMESLIFGTSEIDLAKITAIGADAQLRGFEVRRDDGTSSSIGRTNAMQYLEIDGCGGERIFYCYANVQILPEGIRFVTNRGRQLIVGKVGRNEKSFPEERQRCRDSLMGIYCHWARRDTPTTELRVVGGFTRKLGCKIFRPKWMQACTYTRHYDTTVPPKGALIGSTLYGTGQERFPDLPSDTATRAWFDCSRPISTIKVATCHGIKSSHLPIVSISFRYTANQVTRSFGPTEFTSPKDTDGFNGNHWCWCSKGSSRDTELEDRPHYTQDEWKVGGVHLEFIQMWCNTEGALTGLQFGSVDGKQSPVWGYHGEEEPIRVPLESSMNNHKVGILFFIEGIGRRSGHDDHVVSALQFVAIPRK